MKLLIGILRVIVVIIALPIMWTFLGLVSLARRYPNLFRIYRG